MPKIETDSFYSGQAVVTNKDKVTQPSNAFRHATEVTSLIKSLHSPTQPIVALISDGGPDHHVTFSSIQVAALTVFCALDLGMLVCVRTCPYQLWQNVAERVMSTLNLALQNVSLARNAMPERFEQLVKNKNSQTAVREAIENCLELCSALRDSMAHPLIAVSQRFMAMKTRENSVKLGLPASDVQLSECRVCETPCLRMCS